MSSNNDSITTTDGTNNLGRRLPTQAEMQWRALNQTLDLLVERKPFTAFSVTLALRNDNPGLEVHHEARPGANLTGVRTIVQNQIMPAIIAQFPMDVTEDVRDWGNPPRPAVTYELDSTASQLIVDALIDNKVDLTGMDFTDQKKVTNIDIKNPVSPTPAIGTFQPSAVIADADDDGKILLPINDDDQIADSKGITNLPIIDLRPKDIDSDDDNATN